MLPSLCAIIKQVRALRDELLKNASRALVQAAKLYCGACRCAKSWSWHTKPATEIERQEPRGFSLCRLSIQRTRMVWKTRFLTYRAQLVLPLSRKTQGQSHTET